MTRSSDRARSLFWLGLVLYGAFYPAFRFFLTLQQQWPDVLAQRDFTNLWMAGHLALQGRVWEIFDPVAFRAATSAALHVTFPNNYSYPPHALFVALPFGAMPYAVAFALWDALSLAAFYLAARRYAGDELPKWVIVSSPAVLTCLLYGHYGLLYGALWLWAFRGSGLAAGVMTIKPHLGLLVAVQMLKSRRALLTAVGTTVILVAASILAFGLDPWRAFFTATFNYQVGLLQSYEWSRYISMVGPIVAYGVVGQILFAVAAIILLTRRFDVFSAATATFLIVPYGYHYDLTVVSFGFSVLLARNWSELQLWEKLVACGAYLAPGLVIGGAWIVPPLLLAGLYVQVRHPAVPEESAPAAARRILAAEGSGNRE
jgi:hypothetical protein